MFMKYVWVTLKFLSMQVIGKDENLFVKLVFYTWRYSCVLLLVAITIQCIIDIYVRDEFILEDVSSNILNSGIFTCSVIRIVYYFIYDQDVEVIKQRMQQLFKFESRTGMTELTMEPYEKFTNAFVIAWSVVLVFTGQFSVLLAWFYSTDTQKLLPVQAWYPYEWQPKYYYEFTLFVQAVIQFIMSFSIGTPDMVYIFSLYLASGQFKLLAWEFEHVVYTALINYGLPKQRVLAFSDKFNNDANEEIDDNYKDIVAVVDTAEFRCVLQQTINRSIATHQELLDFCSMLNDFFSPILLPCLSFGVYYIIFIAFTLVITTDQSAIFGLVEYQLTALTEIFLLGYFGQILTDEYEGLRGSLYAAAWYIGDERFKSCFKFVHYVVSKPIAIKAGNYFTMGLDMFVAVCRTSASYFAVLRQVTEMEEVQ